MLIFNELQKHVIGSEVEESVIVIRDTMEPDYNFWVYIITNRTHTVLYIEMTNDLARRTGEHRAGMVLGFLLRFAARSSSTTSTFDK